MTYSAVYACVGIVSQIMATMPVRTVYSPDGKTREVDTDHPSHYINNITPDGEMTSIVGRETLQAHTMLRGNNVAEIVRNNRGQAIRMYPLDPNRIHFRRKDGRRQYIVNDPDGEKILDESQVFHIPCLSWNGFVGKSPITLARETIGLGLATEHMGSTFFGKGGRPLGFLTKPSVMTNKQRKTLQQEWKELHSGLRNALNVGVLSGGLDWKQVSISPNDCQFLETRRFQLQEICRWFRVPPHMIAELSNSKFNNIETMSLEFLLYCLLPWIKKWEAEMNLKFFTRVEQNRYYCKFDFSELLRADSRTRAEVSEKLIRNAINSPDEVRDSYDLNPWPDGIGSKALVMASQLATLDDVASGRLLTTGSAQGKKKDAPEDSSRLAKIIRAAGKLNAADQKKLIVTLLGTDA